MNQYHRVVTAWTKQNSTASSSTSSVTNTTVTVRQPNESIVFVDLGSGDGRIVFHAAFQEQLFTHCIGYEINPFLHCYALLRQNVYRIQHFTSRTTTSATKATSSRIGPIRTDFYLRDLWNVDLRHVHVVAIVRPRFTIFSSLVPKNNRIVFLTSRSIVYIYF
jgi:hypothetical protein